VVLLTSGIIDERRPVWSGHLSTARVFAWVWNLVVGLVWFGLAHCWVLKNHTLCLLVGVGVFLGLLSAGLTLLGLGWWVGGLVV